MNSEKNMNPGQEVYEESASLLKVAQEINLKLHNQYTKKNLDRIRNSIKTVLDEAEQTWNRLFVNGLDSEKNNACYAAISDSFSELEKIKNDTTYTEDKLTAAQSVYFDLYNKYRELEYSFKTAEAETNNVVREDEFEHHENTSMILLCKNVRIMEDVINKICSNNIDKSIVGGERQFDSMKYGFQWLFCHEDINVVRDSEIIERKQLDIRDSNRYLDYIKYQILVASKKVPNSARTSGTIDKLFDQIRYIFENEEDLISYQARQEHIRIFKERTKNLIDSFFSVYSLLVKYRSLRFQEEEIRRGLIESENGSANSDVLSADEHLINIYITNLSSVAVRVLLDRFVSFVKISELNFGNSTFKCAWFNYSELSKSNYAGSDFKYVRIENARMLYCDISTCNLTRADGGNTDFTGSNFTYSNLCGMNLNDATLNDCDFQNAIFTDGNISGYKKALENYMPKSLSDPESIRIKQLYNIWKSTPAVESTLHSKIEQLSNRIKTLPILPITNIQSVVGIPSKVLDYSSAVNWSQKPNIDSLCYAITEQYLSKFISTELTDYIRIKFSNPKNQHHKARLKKYGKVYLDAADLKNVSAKNANFNGIILNRVTLDQGSFENADLSSGSMYYNSAHSASFIGSNLNHVDCFESNFYLANFSSAVANNAVFSNSNLEHTNWNRAILVNTVFMNLSRYVERFFMRTDSEAIVDERFLFVLDKDCAKEDNQEYMSHQNSLPKQKSRYWQDNCTLCDASFVDTLADRSLFICIVADRSTFNHASIKDSLWFNCQAILADFIGADFRYSMLSHCNLGQSNLSNANLTKTDIRYVDFSDCNLQNGLFNLCDMNHALFSNVNCRGMNLSRTTIRNSVFKDCKYDHVIVSNASFESCVFNNVDFIDLVGFHSSIFSNCYFKNCTFRRGQNGVQPINGSGNLRELVED